MGQQMSYLQDQAMAAAGYKKSGKDQEAALDKALKSAQTWVTATLPRLNAKWKKEQVRQSQPAFRQKKVVRTKYRRTWGKFVCLCVYRLFRRQ